MYGNNICANPFDLTCINKYLIIVLLYSKRGKYPSTEIFFPYFVFLVNAIHRKLCSSHARIQLERQDKAGRPISPDGASKPHWGFSNDHSPTTTLTALYAPLRISLQPAHRRHLSVFIFLFISVSFPVSDWHWHAPFRSFDLFLISANDRYLRRRGLGQNTYRLQRTLAEGHYHARASFHHRLICREARRRRGESCTSVNKGKPATSARNEGTL